MILQAAVDEQLKSLNLRLRMFGRSEIKELRKLLQSGEKIRHCVYGFYQGGSGLLVATDQRVLLIDKRPFFLNIEDMKYDTLRKADVSLRYLQASLHLYHGFKRLSFRSVSDARLREMKEYITEKIQGAVLKEEQSLVTLKESAKPYLNPAWRPRHTTLLPRRRPQKFPVPMSPNTYTH